MSVPARKSPRGRVLLVDLGNTRLKWAWLGRSLKPGVMHAGGLPPLRAADRVLAVSVASAAVRRKFVAEVRRQTGHAPFFVRSTTQAAGVHNGYREPWRLGADRWVALLGARPLAKDVLVVDAGTAVTLDLLDAQGVHHGGFILPGLELMVASLFERTGGIRRRAAVSGKSAASARATVKLNKFGTTTREAVVQGALHAIAASVDGAVKKAGETLGRKPLVLLTGGDARQISRALCSRFELRPKLVLEGLARLFKD